jgi:hypothetical protein
VRALLGAQATTTSKAQTATANRGQLFHDVTGMQKSSCATTERPACCATILSEW